jgi:hypothetical protein
VGKAALFKKVVARSGGLLKTTRLRVGPGLFYKKAQQRKLDLQRLVSEIYYK